VNVCVLGADISISSAECFTDEYGQPEMIAGKADRPVLRVLPARIEAAPHAVRSIRGSMTAFLVSSRALGR
jgi:hypothetical protein